MIDALTNLIRMLMNPGSQIGLMINYVIAAIFAIVLVRLIGINLSLRRERSSLAKTWKNSRQEHRSANGDTQSAADDQIGVVCEQLLAGTHPKSMVARRAGALVRLRYVSRGATESLAKMEEDRGQTILALPRFGATVPILLGLLGTLWGLAWAVTSIQPMLTNIHSLEQLQEAMAAIVLTLSSMKTAFTTSIAGLGAGLSLSWLATITSKRYQQILQDLEHITALELMPSLSIPEESKAAAAFSTALTQSAELLRRATRSMETWTKDLTEAVKETRNGQQQMAGFAESFRLSVEGLKSFQGEFQVKILEHYKTLNTSLKEVGTAATTIGDTHKRLEEVVDSMKANYSATEELIKLANEQRKTDEVEFEKALQEVANVSASAVEELKILAQSLSTQTADQVAKSIEEIVETSRQPFAGFFDGVAASIQIVVDGLSNQFDQMANGNKKYSEELDRTRVMACEILTLNKQILTQQKSLLAALAAEGTERSSSSPGGSLAAGTDRSEN